jgi:hypothetical protein
MRHGLMPGPIWTAACLIAWAATAAGQDYYLSEGRLGVRTAPLLLLSRPDVRADLQLNAEQAAAALHEIDQLYTKAEDLRGRGNGSEVVNQRRLLDRAQQEWCENNLTPAQSNRLDQIDLQWEGPSALLRSRVGMALKLSDAQRQALQRAIDDRHRERVAGKASAAGERQLAEQALAILTPEQRQHWLRLLGPPLRFEPRAPVRQQAAAASRRTAR